MTTALPVDSARMAWFLSGWLRGDVAPDDLTAAVMAGDAAHHVAGLPGEDGFVTLVLALGRLRGLGTSSAGLAAPVPGDLAGLGGPAEFNAAALEVGEAVVLEGAALGLVPHRAGAGVVWQLYPASRRQVVDLGEADRTLRAAVPEAAGALAALDVARWRPEVADELMNLRHLPAYDAPPGTPPRAVDLAARAVQALAIVELALEDDGGALNTFERTARQDALRPLGRAGRQALVAACSPEVWPPADS